jgi:hypothetical protein
VHVREAEEEDGGVCFVCGGSERRRVRGVAAGVDLSPGSDTVTDLELGAGRDRRGRVRAREELADVWEEVEVGGEADTPGRERRELRRVGHIVRVPGLALEVRRVEEGGADLDEEDVEEVDADADEVDADEVDADEADEMDEEGL